MEEACAVESRVDAKKERMRRRMSSEQQSARRQKTERELE
jgi:hypothetical protein